MYVPSPFRENDIRVLHGLMREYSFATLITSAEGHPLAGHLPFLLDPERGPFGTLRAHLARANPQTRHLADGQEALVVFLGPDAYISPSWYAAHPSVPTWNYAAVHAYGTPRLADESTLRGILRDMVAYFEAGKQESRTLDLPEDYLAGMLAGIVGFEIEIARLEGKLKLGQNRSDADREGVIRALRQTGDPANHRMADWMEGI